MTRPAPDRRTGPGAGLPAIRQRTTLRDRVLDLRDRLLADPGFQRWAARFPPTRWIARRRARTLFDLCAGFVYTQVLAACVELGLFDLLRAGPQTVAELSERLSLPPPATERLLRAASSLRLASDRGGDRFGLGELGAALIGNPGIADMVRHHRLLYADLGDPVALLRRGGRGTRLSRYWPYAADGDDGAERPESDYSALMSASQPLIAEEVLDAYPLGRHRCLLDLGGGEGRFAAAAAARWPDLRVMLFDLPPVAARARARFRSDGLGDRADAVGGDFLRDPLPEGADVVSLVRIVHDHDDAGALRLLGAVRAALPPDGTLLLAEPMAGTAGAEPVGDAYFGFYLLAMGSGRPRTAAELADLLRAAGFRDIRAVATRMPLLVRLIVARPAG